MGTRADFYLKTGKKLQIEDWLGSIAWDGYPDGIDKEILIAQTPHEFKKALKRFFNNRNDVTFPNKGWPWPWEDSNTTDYSYVFIDDHVRIFEWGDKYTKEPIGFPDMDKIQNTVLSGDKSGLITMRRKDGT